ncbi:MAG: NADH-quinone oxidoreductase subunit N [Puniceicoccales bacterium]|jgi:NADH-quinone oxidoreductase subunit N|nr:NADH-quinone oxidoreductase subunit N [Puniceicoccales bacterium]
MNDCFQWSFFVSEIGLAALSLLVLVLDVALPTNLRRFIPGVVLAGLAGLIAGLVPSLAAPSDGVRNLLFGGMIAQTHGLGAAGGPSSDVMRLFFLVAAFLVIWLGVRFSRKFTLPMTGFLLVVLVVAAGLSLLVQSNNFVMFFVTLEAVSTGFCVLIASRRGSGASLEAGLKYLVMAGLSSALLLFGITLLYGAVGNPVLGGGVAATGFDALEFSRVGAFIAGGHRENPFVLAGVALVTCGVAFKIGMFPFHFWIPDVYQGAPMPVTAFLAVASKAAGVVALLLLMNMPFAALSGSGGVLYLLLSLGAGVTLVCANLVALGQTNVKRLMGMSGVSHAGFLLLALLASRHEGNGLSAMIALIAYLAAYLVGAMAVFGVMSEMSVGERESDAETTQIMLDYRLLGERSPFLAAVLGVGLGSLAGIPPSLGFVAKFLVIMAAFNAGLWTLTAVALLCVCAGVYYYFAWMREAFQRVWVDVEARRSLFVPRPPWTSRLVLFCLSVVILIGGLVQSVWRIFQ